MKKYLTIPHNIEVTIHELFVTCVGPLGTMKLEIPSSLILTIERNKITIEAQSKAKQVKAILGTFRSLLRNSVKGINTGHFKQLNLVGVGYRIEKLDENNFNFKLGFSNDIHIKNNASTSINLLKPTIVQVKGPNKQVTFQQAAKLRDLRPPEPYKGKGILYKNEVILRKEGKKLS
jgi:large subunit ribosomal protein L6